MNVVVVGASSGIGREVARVFACEGHTIVCSARDKKELTELVSDLEIQYGCSAYGIPVDITERSSIRNFFEKIDEHFATIDCVVVTAAIMPSYEIPYHDEKCLLTTTMTNYTGIALFLNEVSRRMACNNSGIIICLSSVAGDRGRRSNFIYGASKSALNTYLQGLRMEMYRHNVRVVTVLPGYVDTPMSYGKVERRYAVSPHYVAEKIYKLTRGNRNIVYIPPIWWLIMRVIRLIPEAVFKKLGSIF